MLQRNLVFHQVHYLKDGKKVIISIGILKLFTAVRKRKWPYRMICKIDKEIMTLLHNVPQGPNAPPLPEEIEAALGKLLRRRQEELRPVVIRI